MKKCDAKEYIYSFKHLFQSGLFESCALRKQITRC